MLSDDDLLEDIKLSKNDVRLPLEFDDRIDINYDFVRSAFELHLIDQWYSSYLVEEIDDGWDEFKIEEYNIYLEQY